MLSLPAPNLPAASIAPPAEEIEARIGELVAAHAFTILVAIHARRRDFSAGPVLEAGSFHMHDIYMLRASLDPDRLASFDAVARQHGGAQLRAICADISDAHVDILIDGTLEVLAKVIRAMAH